MSHRSLKTYIHHVELNIKGEERVKTPNVTRGKLFPGSKCEGTEFLCCLPFEVETLFVFDQTHGRSFFHILWKMTVSQCSKWDVSLLVTVTRALGQQFRGCYRVRVHLLPPTSSVGFGIATVVPHHSAPTRPHGQRTESAPPPSVTVERVQTCDKACRIIRFNTECGRVSSEFTEFPWTIPFNSNDHDIKFEPTGVFDGYNIPRYN